MPKEKFQETRPKDTKGEMTFVMFQLKGSDETLQQGFKAMEQAFEKLAAPARMYVVGSKVQDALPVAPNGSAATRVADTNDTIIEVQPEEPSAEENSPKAGKPSRPRRYPIPKVIELDLHSGNPSLRDFYAQKGSLAADSKKSLIIAAWLKEQLNINAIKADHVYTCCRFMTWSVQRDLLQPLRAMKKQGWFVDGTETGSYVINHIGLDQVRKMGTTE